jgi:predicted PurR-regulated permease PerM
MAPDNLQEETRAPLLRHPIIVGVALIVIYTVLSALLDAKEAWFMGFLAILMAVVFSFPVGLLSRVMPRGLAVICTLVTFLIGVAGMGLLAAPVISHQVKQLAVQVPEAASRLDDWFTEIHAKSGVSQMPQGNQLANRLKDRAAKAVEEVASMTVPAAFGALYGLSGAFLVLILGAFLVLQPDTYRRALRTLVPAHYNSVFDESWRRLGQGLRHWIGGILISMSIMGVFTATALKIAGIDDWFMLGVLTCAGTFIPYAGAIVTSVPGLILALAQSPRHLAYAMIVYLGVHIVEGYIVQPLVMKRAVELKPGTLLFWQLLMGSIFGLMGIVVATPLLVCAEMLVGYLYIERNLHKSEAKA